jgi:hypothetical protein
MHALYSFVGSLRQLFLLVGFVNRNYNHGQ